MASTTTKQALSTDDLRKELIAGSNALTAYLHSLNAAIGMPRWIDDAERDFGTAIYDKMLRDPAINSAVSSIKTGVLAEGPRFVNPISAPSKFKKDPEAEAKYSKAEEICAEMEHMCDRLQQSLEDILNEMMDYPVYGHKLAEKVYALDGDKLVLRVLRTKPRDGYTFALTGTMDCLGVVPVKPLGGQGFVTGMEVQPSEVLDRSKLFVLTHDSVGSDPRGQSIIRPAYNAWYLKQQTWPAALKWLIQFGTPSVLGIMAEGIHSLETAAGTSEEITAAQAFCNQLVNWASGTAIAVEYGADVRLIESNGDGTAFRAMIDLYNREMKDAILIAARATTEALHGSKADSETASDVVDQLIKGMRRRVEKGFHRDVTYPTVAMNYGKEVADELCPRLTLSDLDAVDTIAFGGMVASLWQSGYLHSSQKPGIDAMLDLPERDYEAEMAEGAEAKAQAQELAHNAYGVGAIPAEAEPEGEEEGPD